MKPIKLILCFFLLVFTHLSAQVARSISLNLQQFSDAHASDIICLSAKNSPSNLRLLQSENIVIKYTTEQYLFFNAQAKRVCDLMKDGKLEQVYFSVSRPMALSDSSLLKHKIHWAHQGLNGIDTNYTGKGVIIGIVDQGIDFNHPDFKLLNGKTRVLRYWDHTVNGANPPQPYNYGTIWDSSSINNGTCTSLETGTAHGTTVSGMAVGNANANFKNKGAAPQADIIVVETNFNLPNWTLTIADACDYIFKVADSLGKPAVVNLSLGDYLGSHDGDDPAADYIESLLDLQSGRIVVCAAGNSGNQGKYHVQKNNIAADTSFFWNIPNTGNTIAGPNKIVFDVWSDTADAHYQYAYGADKINPNYSYRGHTDFQYATSHLNTVPYLDTIYNSVGQRIACIATYTEIIGGNFHMLSVFQTIDSMAYRYRFMTTGSGKYDAWGGSWLQLSNFSTNIPTALQYPAIQNYVMPDSLQTVVSSWNCSEKVISVGNMRNRRGYIDKNNNYYLPASLTPVGKLSENSSKGPNRHGMVKPDITAAGDVTLASGPLWYLSNPANNSTIDQGGFHVRNGGTSMSSPVVAGIAALYLQKCPLASYSQFRTDLINSALVDTYTGVVPNVSYGFGKADAHALLVSKNATITMNAPNGICLGSTASISFTTPQMISNAVWSNGATGYNINTAFVGPYSVRVTDGNGCVTRSAVVTLGSLSVPFVDAGAGFTTCPQIPITLSGTGTAQTYSWLESISNGMPFVPTQNQTYHLTGIGSNGCQALDSITVNIFDVDPVSYTENTSSVFSGSNPFNVTPGAPVGGSYSGIGIIGTSFHPTLSGPGAFTITYSITDANGCISSDSSVINVVSGVSLSDVDQDDFSIYPNPNQGIIHIVSQAINLDYSISDAFGRILKQGVLMQNQTFIDLNSWAAGHYFLKVDKRQLRFTKI